MPDVPNKFLSWKEYRNERRREKLQEELRRDYTLKIHPQNVQYLILPYSKTERNVLRMHDYIMDLYGSRFDRTEAALVVTTIMTDDALEDM